MNNTHPTIDHIFIDIFSHLLLLCEVTSGINLTEENMVKKNQIQNREL